MPAHSQIAQFDLDIFLCRIKYAVVGHHGCPVRAAVNGITHCRERAQIIFHRRVNRHSIAVSFKIRRCHNRRAIIYHKRIGQSRIAHRRFRRVTPAVGRGYFYFISAVLERSAVPQIYIGFKLVLDLYPAFSADLSDIQPVY